MPKRSEAEKLFARQRTRRENADMGDIVMKLKQKKGEGGAEPETEHEPVQYGPRTKAETDAIRASASAKFKRVGSIMHQTSRVMITLAV